MRKSIFRAWISAALALVLAVPAQAQFSDSYTFLKAVRERDGVKASEFLNSPGSTVVNTRDRSTGDTGLHIATERRDSTWMQFLLQKGARPDVENNEGATPLMLTASLRFIDGAKLLLAMGASVDASNRRGETALIRAVQLKDVTMVRLLLDAGANPDITDTVAGLSARDYAERDARDTSIAQIIRSSDEDRKAKKDADAFVGPVG